MQVARPCGSGGHVCRMGDLTRSFKAQLRVNLHLFAFTLSDNCVNAFKIRPPVLVDAFKLHVNKTNAVRLEHLNLLIRGVNYCVVCTQVQHEQTTARLVK